MTRIITIRPEPGASATVKAGKAAGLAIAPFPLSHVEPREWTGPDPDSVDALLVGSANVFRHGGPELARYRDKPGFVVGNRTASAAREAGFTVELAGDGGLQKLLSMIDHRPVRMLRLAGKRMIEVTAPEGITVETRIVYSAYNQPIPSKLEAMLLAGDALVLLHSAGAAEHLRSECLRLGLDLAAIRLAALGPRIADAAGGGWGEVRVAENPANGVLLAIAAQMCQ